MAHCMRAGLQIAKQTDKADSFTQTVTYTLANGKMTNHTVKGCTYTRMELDMKASGETTSSMGTGMKLGRMARAIRVHTKLAKNMGLDNSRGPMAAPLSAILSITILRVLVSIVGLTGECMMDPGSITKWMEKECLLGPTVEDTRANISTTRKKVTEYSPGLKEKPTTEAGKMENSTASQPTNLAGEPKRGNGKMGRESSGLRINHWSDLNYNNFKN